MKKKEYSIGHYDHGLFALVRILIKEYEVLGNKSIRRCISIVFDRTYTFHELKSKGLELPFYTGSGYRWECSFASQEELNKELRRLSSVGFTIPRMEENIGLQEYLATKI